MAKKIRVEDIDSEFIINSFRQDDLSIPPSARTVDAPAEPSFGPSAEVEPPAAPAPEPTRREEPRRRKPSGKDADYKTLFLKSTSEAARNGKTVYIRKAFHERIMLILRVICKDEISLFDYIDNVLAHHFDTFQEEITRLYNENNQSIF